MVDSRSDGEILFSFPLHISWNIAHTVKLGKAGEYRFVDTFFSFLRRHTSVLNTVESIEKLQDIAQKHCGQALDEAEAMEEITQHNAEMAALEEEHTPAKACDAPSTMKDETSAPTDEQHCDKQEDIPASTNTGADPNPGNGGDGPGYTWTQTLTEVAIKLKLDKDVKGRDCNVEIEDGQLIVSIRNEVVLDGTLFAAVKPDQLTWTVEDAFDGKEQQARSLMVYVAKVNQMEWWGAVVKEHPHINVEKIKPENARLDDLDASTRSMVQKMMVRTYSPYSPICPTHTHVHQNTTPCKTQELFF